MTRWAPSYGALVNGLLNWQLGFFTPSSGVLTILVTGRGPCSLKHVEAELRPSRSIQRRPSSQMQGMSASPGTFVRFWNSFIELGRREKQQEAFPSSRIHERCFLMVRRWLEVRMTTCFFCSFFPNRDTNEFHNSFCSRVLIVLSYNHL